MNISNQELMMGAIHWPGDATPSGSTGLTSGFCGSSFCPIVFVLCFSVTFLLLYQDCHFTRISLLTWVLCVRPTCRLPVIAFWRLKVKQKKDTMNPIKVQLFIYLQRLWELNLLLRLNKLQLNMNKIRFWFKVDNCFHIMSSDSLACIVYQMFCWYVLIFLSDV
jgi:hypothetical protein